MKKLSEARFSQVSRLGPVKFISLCGSRMLLQGLSVSLSLVSPFGLFALALYGCVS